MTGKTSLIPQIVGTYKKLSSDSQEKDPKKLQEKKQKLLQEKKKLQE